MRSIEDVANTITYGDPFGFYLPTYLPALEKNISPLTDFKGDKFIGPLEDPNKI